jgi:hypothetical protein
MANENVLDGMACPECKSEGPFKISVTIFGVVNITDDGYDLNDLEISETEWDDLASCDCTACGFFGYVDDYKIGAKGRPFIVDEAVMVLPEDV